MTVPEEALAQTSLLHRPLHVCAAGILVSLGLKYLGVRPKAEGQSPLRKTALSASMAHMARHTTIDSLT